MKKYVKLVSVAFIAMLFSNNSCTSNYNYTLLSCNTYNDYFKSKDIPSKSINTVDCEGTYLVTDFKKVKPPVNCDIGSCNPQIIPIPKESNVADITVDVYTTSNPDDIKIYTINKEDELVKEIGLKILNYDQSNNIATLQIANDKTLTQQDITTIIEVPVELNGQIIQDKLRVMFSKK